jgi:hypothetical protein
VHIDLFAAANVQLWEEIAQLGFWSIRNCRVRECGRRSSGKSDAAARSAEAMTSSGDASGGAASTPSTNAWRNCCCP